MKPLQISEPASQELAESSRIESVPTTSLLSLSLTSAGAPDIGTLDRDLSASGLYTCQINIIDAVAGHFAFPRLVFYVR